MHKYEITIITKEDLKEDVVKKEIESLGGKIIKSDALGQKQLAFPIKKETAGYYTAVIFEMEPEKLLDLNRKLSLKNEIIRHLIIISRVDRIAAQEQARPEKKETEEVAEAAVEAPEEKVAEEPVVEEKPAKPAKKPVAIEKAPEAEIVEVPTEKPKEVKKPARKASGKSAKDAEADAKEPEVSTEERLKALDQKLDELLKE
jgi:small subunit ribosomal protein S6